MRESKNEEIKLLKKEYNVPFFKLQLENHSLGPLEIRNISQKSDLVLYSSMCFKPKATIPLVSTNV